MKNKIGVFVIGLVFLMTGFLSSVNAGTTPQRIDINCGSITLNTQDNPDTCIAIPINNYNINVGPGGEIYVSVNYDIQCTSWDDHGYVKIYFYGDPNNKADFETGGNAQGTLTIHDYFGPDEEFRVVLYGHIWYDVSGPESETQENSYCSTAPYNPNQAPNKPSRPSGPTSIVEDNTYTWSSSATDPDGDNVYMKFYWGDGTNSGWLGPYGSGETVEADHSYSNQGSYSITTQAKDYELTGPISDPLAIACKLSEQH